MNVSDNAFSKKTLNTGSNSWTEHDNKVSANSFSKKDMRNPVAWNGKNLADGGLGDNLLSPSPFGEGEDGFSHFNFVNQPDITHDATQQDLIPTVPTQPETGH